MKRAVVVAWLGLATQVACPLARADAPRTTCRHFLATVGSAGDMPYSVVQALRPWMALHIRNDVAAAQNGPVNADFLWGAESGDRWIVVFSERGSGKTRFALFAPISHNSATYRAVKPDNRDWFADATCRGIDAELDAYAGAP